MNKANWRVIPLAGFLVGGLFACSSALPADSDRVALEAAIQRWVKAVNAQDVATLTRTMTEDVELLGSNARATGRDAAIRALREAVTQGKLVSTSQELTITNDTAWHVVGLTQTQKNGDVQARGQALEIWNRVQGEWQLHRRMESGAYSPEVLLTRPPLKEPVLDTPKQ